MGSDRSQLANVANGAKAVLQTDELDAVADRGYFNGVEILAYDRAGITVTLPKPMTSGAKLEGRFGKQDFVYLPEEDVYRCPAGERLTFHYVNEENGQKLRRYWTNACGTCAIKHRCTTARSVASAAGSTSMCWRRCRGVSTRILRPCVSAARRSSTFRHAQDADGRDTLPDEAAAEGRHRDGAARACLQSHARDEHRRCEAAPGGDPGLSCGLSWRFQVTQNDLWELQECLQTPQSQKKPINAPEGARQPVGSALDRSETFLRNQDH